MNIYEQISAFYESYRGIKEIYGTSEEGRNLYAFFTGEAHAPLGICQYAIHAREWITARLALEQLAVGVPRGGVWFIPLANPDGALLCTEGIGSVRTQWRKQFLLRMNGGEDFSLWKANADAVDLNVNFDARWGTGKSNRTKPASANYIGMRPFSAKESRALKDFTYRVCPQFTVSYHTKGEEIYWRFHQPFFRAARDKRLAKRLSESTGYPLREAPFSAGGYKDWCVEKLKISAFTLEAGADELSHPLGEDALPQILARNLYAIRHLIEGLK